jgi:hypothetical protein
VRWASRLIGEPQLNLETLQTSQLQTLVGSVLEDGSQPLHVEFQLLPSGRRFKMPLGKTKMYRGSFVPSAIKTLNNT